MAAAAAAPGTKLYRTPGDSGGDVQPPIVTIPKYRIKADTVEYIVEVVAPNGATKQVYRRYNDFKQLHATLSEKFGVFNSHHHEVYGVLPNLCSTVIGERTNENAELIKRRQRFLEAYLQQLLVPANRFYPEVEEVKNFLFANEISIASNRSRGARLIPGLSTTSEGDIDLRVVVAQDGTLSPSVVDDLNTVTSAAAATEVLSRAHVDKEKIDKVIFRAPDACLRVGGDDTRSPAELTQLIALELDKAESAISPCVADFIKAHMPVVEEVLDATGGSRTAQRTRGRENSVSPQGHRGTSSPAASTRGRVTASQFAQDRTPFEECDTCHTVTWITTYTVDQWQSYGRCDTCKANRCFTLHKPAPLDPTPPTAAAVAEASTAVAGGAETPTRGGSMEPPSGSTTTAAGGDGAAAAAGSSVPDAAPAAAGRPGTCQQCDTVFAAFVNPHECDSCHKVFCGGCAHLSPSSGMRYCKECRKLRSSFTPEGSPGGPAYHSGGSAYRIEAPFILQTPNSLDDFAFLTTLGKGTFGKVIKVRHRPTNRIFALKVMGKGALAAKNMESFIRDEQSIMAKLGSHPFICRLHTSFQTPNHLFFVMDYLPGGELYAHLQQLGHFSESTARFYIWELILAVQHIHNKDICHRDLKPENLTLDADGHAKVIDFGLAASNFSQAGHKQFVGSAEYISPEIVRAEKQTVAVDWWCVGCILYEMLSGKTPFYAPTPQEIYKNVLNKPLDFKKPCFQSEGIVDLLKGLLDRDPRQRRVYATTKMLTNPWLTVFSREEMENKRKRPPFVPDLKANDTKYFGREYVSEWATLPNAQPLDRREHERLQNLLSANFPSIPVSAAAAPVAPGGKASRVTSQAVMNDSLAAAAAGGPVPVSSTSSIARNLVSPNMFVGVWRLRRVSLVSTTGLVSYPWGSQVCGMLIYTANLLYSLQLCPIKRATYRDRNRPSKDEMVDAFMTYVSSFGQVDVVSGQSILVHRPVAAVCPEMARIHHRRTFFVTKDTLTLQALTPSDIMGDGVASVATTEWERVV